MDMTASFTYEAFPVSEIETRLLSFSPGFTGSEDVLDLEIQVMRLPDELNDQAPPQYLAISYFWGNTEETAEVNIDGRILTVPKNTVRALRSLHFFLGRHGSEMLSEGEASCFWIDAICIDQRNDQERVEQVSIMRQIYEKASGVLVWLGDAAENVSESATREIHAIFKDSLVHFDGITFPPRKEPHDLVAFGRRQRGMRDPPPWFHDRRYNWNSIKPLYDSPWFGRLWTTQETVVAKRAICAFGNHHLPLYEIIMVAFSIARAEYAEPPSALASIAQSLELAACRLSMKRLFHGRMNLLSIIKLILIYTSTDPRDMIYGVLGLYDDREHLSMYAGQLLNINYKLPCEVVFAKATLYCILESQSLEPLQIATTQSLPRLPTDFPSWALRLLGPRDRNPLLKPFWPQFPLQHLYRHSDFVSHSTDYRTLNLQGAIYDEVKTVVHTDVLPGREPEFGDKLREILSAVRTHFGSLGEDFLATIQRISTTIATALYARNEENLSENSGKLFAMLEQAAFSETFFRKVFYFAIPVRKQLRRVFFVTVQGRIGMGPPTTAPGDSVCVFLGGPVPFVLRPEGDSWTLIGDAYVHDLEKEFYCRRILGIPPDGVANHDFQDEPDLRRTFHLV